MSTSEPPELKPLPPIEVSIYAPEKAEALSLQIAPQQRRTSVDWGRWLPRRGRVGSVVCGVVIAALHVLVVVPLLPGAGHPHQVSHAMGSASAADVEPAIQVSLIEEPPLTRMPPPPITALQFQTPPLPPLDPPPDLLKSYSDKSPQNPTQDGAGSSALAGRYLGQIDARIERAWLKPRTPVETGVFHCAVRVEQDTTGAVKEIELEQCGGDARWQQSLVRAIQSASPLPAPPDPSVFRKALQLSFTGRAYSAQASDQEYESPGVGNSQLP